MLRATSTSPLAAASWSTPASCRPPRRRGSRGPLGRCACRPRCPVSTRARCSRRSGATPSRCWLPAPPPRPQIAAGEGWALAGGCELALSADLVVASRSARFGLPEVKRGLVAAGGGLLRLPKALPYAVAMRVALTGEPISAEEAERFGLVS